MGKDACFGNEKEKGSMIFSYTCVRTIPYLWSTTLLNEYEYFVESEELN